MEKLAKKTNDIPDDKVLTPTPLHAAAARGHVEIVELLIKAGAVIDCRNELGETPLHLAATSEVVQTLLKYGADIEAKDDKGETPIHEAVKYGNAEVVKALIAAGADVNAPDNEGLTPLNKFNMVSGLQQEETTPSVSESLQKNAQRVATDVSETTPVQTPQQTR